MTNAILEQPLIRIDSEVTRRVRRHARAHMQTEVCGVLIGKMCDGVIEIEAPIEAFNASQAGAHVTFTQAAWETIYRVKDKQYPEERIVGWYHSHPGFGVFLSDHDTFIHRNFFSSPDQIAWVYDPHSDEEGCFGWVDGSIRRIAMIHVADNSGDEPGHAYQRADPSWAAAATMPLRPPKRTAPPRQTVPPRETVPPKQTAPPRQTVPEAAARSLREEPVSLHHSLFGWLQGWLQRVSTGARAAALAAWEAGRSLERWYALRYHSLFAMPTIVPRSAQSAVEEVSSSASDSHCGEATEQLSSERSQ